MANTLFFSLVALISVGPPSLATAQHSCARSGTTPVNAATRDTPRNKKFPGAIILVGVPSHGERVNAVLSRATGEGRHPLVILLHGFPGTEQNSDLAHAMRRVGWHVIAPRYRGAWGSSGTYSWAHVVEDAEAVLTWARNDSVAAQYGIAPGTIALVGHSLGGFVALRVAARDPGVTAVASLAGFNFGAYTESLAGQSDPVQQTAESWSSSAAVLHGTSGRALAEEAFAAGREWDLRRLAPQLAARPTLLLAASADEVAPPALHHLPLLVALREAGARDLTTRTFATDHSFVDTRVRVAMVLTTWLSHVASQRTGVSDYPSP